MKNTFFVYIIHLFLATLFLAACDSTTSDTSATSDIEVDQDTVLVEEADEEVGASAVDLILLAFMNNRMQYMMGEIAQQQASSEAVRDYAESIVTRDDETRWKLEDIAEASNANLPEAIGAEQRVVIDSIRQLSGEQFDQAYLERTVYEYRENIERLNELIREADNPLIEGTAAEIIDIQQAHMERAASVLEEIS